MARLIFEDLTLKQAECLATWYCESGEQDSEIWLTEDDLPGVYVDVRRMAAGCIIEGEDVILRTRSTL